MIWLVREQDAPVDTKLEAGSALCSSSYYRVGDTPLTVARRYNNTPAVNFLRKELRRKASIYSQSTFDASSKEHAAEEREEDEMGYEDVDRKFTDVMGKISRESRRTAGNCCNCTSSTILLYVDARISCFSQIQAFPRWTAAAHTMGLCLSRTAGRERPHHETKTIERLWSFSMSSSQGSMMI
mgnify:CR=1 FL=1|tara:strand:+ start:109 stop:657 length:549 start_codon:yes stop_codon:yes gene_type:complete